MRALISTGFMTLIILAGFCSQASAQARGSVRYTIVVTEDMLAENKTPGNQQLMDEMPAASVSIQLHDERAAASGPVFNAFEAEMSPAQSPEIVSYLSGQLSDEQSTDDSDISTMVACDDYKSYLVVMEFN